MPTAKKAVRDYRHLTGKKVRRPIKSSNIFDYGVIVYAYEKFYLVEPTEEGRCEEQWFKTDCEIV